ncbi:6691_t:CDS:2, partial [Acaulospora morrowiae]
TCSAVRTSRLYSPSDCTSQLYKDNEGKFQKVCTTVRTAKTNISIRTNRRTVGIIS